MARRKWRSRSVDDVSLVAVFIPVLFMGGIVGRLLHEFAVTITAAILVSGFVSISLTPMLCSRFLKPPHAISARPPLQRCSSGCSMPGRRAYDGRCASSLSHRFVTMACLVAADGGDGLPVHRGAEGLPAERGPGPIQRQHVEAHQGIGFDEMVRHQAGGRHRGAGSGHHRAARA